MLKLFSRAIFFVLLTLCVPMVDAEDTPLSSDVLHPEAEANVSQRPLSVLQESVAAASSDDGYNAGPDEVFDLSASRQAAAIYEAGLPSSAVSRKRGDPIHLTFDDPGATVGFTNALESAWTRVAKRPHLQQLWETSPFLSPLFGSSGSASSGIANLCQFGLAPPMPQLTLAPREVTMELTRKRLALADNMVFARAVKKFSNLSWPDSNEIDRAKAIGRWRFIIGTAPEQFEIGRMILEDLATGSEASVEEKVIADAFANKATRTLLVRAGPLILYIQYCKRLDLSAFPILEPQIYQYICFLRDAGSAATKAASFKSSLAFAMGSLGLIGVDLVLSSSRVSGAAFMQHLMKPMLKQRRAFYVMEVLWFEELCGGAIDVRDRVFAGYLLFLIYARARSGDCALVSHVLWDVEGSSFGFVEVGTTSAKTSRTVAQRTRFLPLTAPRLGLLSEPWADNWKRARLESGLQDFSDESGFPLMPAPLLTGGWSDRPLSAGEVRKWTIELLLIRDEQTPTDLLGTRSGKVTGLSWMSKVGAIDSVRRFLGYHIAPGDKSMSTYSRDAAAEPLRQFCKMLSMIRLGVFEPDKTRSGYLSDSVRILGFYNWDETMIPSLISAEESHEAPEEESDSQLGSVVSRAEEFVLPSDLIVQAASESEQSSSSDESVGADVSLAAEEVVKPGGSGSQPSSSVCADVLFFHDTLTTVHVQSVSDPAKLRCGRTLRRGFTKMQAVVFHWPKCKDCFLKCIA